MKYDVFISYSRRDYDEVCALVKKLQERIPTLSCFFDVKDIEVAEKFDDKIVSSIDDAKYVVFALSKNSMQSTWTKTEIAYAQNTGKKIIPVLLGGSKLEKGWFLFKFGRTDCIDSTNPIQVDKLVNNLSRWTSKDILPPIDESVDNSELKRKYLYPIVATLIALVSVIVNIDTIKDWLGITPAFVENAVDLGLRTGTLWGKCNLGALNEHETGNFYIWGGVTPVRQQPSPSKELQAIEKIIGTDYDVAFKTLGDKWKLPSEEQMLELINECKWEWQEEYSGYRVIGPNGNYIFLPAAGCVMGKSIHYDNERGYYWTGESNLQDLTRAKELLFWKNTWGPNSGAKNVGRTIRPVYKN